MPNMPPAQQIRARAAIKLGVIKLLGLACALGTLLPSIAQAPADVRIALVIGNAAYPGKAALTNPGNDAKAMGETLRGLGFTVVEVRDSSRAQMMQAISTVRDNLKGRQGTGMLYYAGHGLQVDWRNYMVPVDAQMSKASDVPEQAVDLGQVIEAFKAAGNKMNIVVLDACRDNPFADTATGKGLAQLDAPPGTFLAYATAPGNVADDGEAKADSNGLYTKFLLQELKKPQAKIEDVFKRVRLNVRQQSQGRQIPWESTSLEDDFFFNAGLKPTQKLSESEKDKAFTTEKADWDKIAGSKNVDDFYAFLQKYPNGNVSGLANARIALLQQASVQQVPDRSGFKQGLVFESFVNGDISIFEWRDGQTNIVRGSAKLETLVRTDDVVQVITNSNGSMTTFQMTREGYIRQDGFGTYDPPYSLIPNGELKIGGKATSRTNVIRGSTIEWSEFSSIVVGRETLETPHFGKVETIKVTTQVIRQNGSRGQITAWYIPDWGNPVRLQRQFRDARGAVTDNSIGELVSRKRAQ